MQTAQSETASACLPNSSQWELKTSSGRSYLIQVAWPLAWKSRAGDGHPTSVFYILDGNAYFFSAVEAVRRCSVLSDSRDAIVVGGGYPPTEYIYNARRNFDLTPPSPSYKPPTDADGKEYPAEHGGADEFVDFLTQVVSQFLSCSVFPQVELVNHTLVGHSYGGLCALHTLFTMDTHFTNFVAISPSIWWNDKFILSEQEEFLRGAKGPTKPVALFLGYGSYEQEPHRRPNWDEDEYKKNVRLGLEKGLGQSTKVMAADLAKSPRFTKVKIKAYQEEDHLSVAICGINWAISSVLDSERFP